MTKKNRALMISGIVAAITAATAGAVVCMNKMKKAHNIKATLVDLDDFTLCKTKPAVMFISAHKLGSEADAAMNELVDALTFTGSKPYLIQTHDANTLEGYDGQDTIILSCPYSGFSSSSFSVATKNEIFNILNGLGKYCRLRQVFIITHFSFNDWARLNINLAGENETCNLVPLENSIDGYITVCKNEDNEIVYKACPYDAVDDDRDALDKESVINYFSILIKNTLADRGLLNR